MSTTVIEVENLGKQYRLGQVGSGTIRDDFGRLWARLRGKEDPTLKIGQANVLSSQNSEIGNKSSDYVWALKDINFSVLRGEVLGIIGKNGAGKSTLLKILSKVTAPTTGSVRIKGRIASLLEVGTGFHPELSGRENIYLNGAILGMTKSEISSKFDAIVDFSGIDKYIDTPVKRYSSGMYVRLAFAVAAHLEPEILIVDEVLAVGDAEFQKKALGKMQEVSKNSGRTVLFVSHNLAAISELCTRGILLSNGEILETNTVNRLISRYLTDSKIDYEKTWDSDNSPGNEDIKITKAYFINDNYQKINMSFISEKFGICFEYQVLKDIPFFINGINVYNELGVHLFTSHELLDYKSKDIVKKGKYIAVVWIPSNLLQDGDIKICFACMRYNPFNVLLYEENLIGLRIIDKLEGSSRNEEYKGLLPGLIRPKLIWDQRKLL